MADAKPTSNEKGRLNGALETDRRQFLLELGELLRREMGFAAVARHTGLNREALYRALADQGNPTFDTLERLLALLGYRFSVVPMAVDRLTNDKRATAIARKYVWWQPAAVTLKDRRLLLAQMMNLGSVADVRWLLSRVPTSELRRVLRDPPIGIFNGRSWNFWHLHLGLTPTPKLPARRLPREMPE